jgi:hypothetical protein
MFDFGKSLINMNPDEQKKMLGNATPGQRKTALEMGIGFKNQNQQQQRQQKRDAYHDLDRLNTIVENENEAHDFFGKSLVNWQKSVTGKKSSKDATSLKKQFDEYEHGILSKYPKGGKRHGALSETLPKIKDDFLKQGHQFALDKLNERSQSVLDKGLQRLAKGALSANDESGVQEHDDAAFDLINKYVLSEAKFDEKDADAMYNKYLGYAGVDLEKARASENKDIPGAKPGFKMEDAEMYAENDTGTASDAGGKEESEPQGKSLHKTEAATQKSSTQNAREMEKIAAKEEQSGKLAGADNDKKYVKKGGADKLKEWTPTQTVSEAKRHVGSEAWREDRERGEFDDESPKCNQFVAEMLEYSGAKVPKVGGTFGGNYPLARDWANEDKQIDGYEVVDAPKPGDVAAYNGHVGIVTENGKTVSASSKKKKIVENDWGFREHQKGKVTFRRYIGQRK